MSVEIVVSYRREDEGDAGRLAERLEDHFGSGRVFLDVARIQGGERFPAAIEAAIRDSRAVIALVTGNWPAGLEQERDWVRRELRQALSEGRPVLPVVLRRAPVPGAVALPGDLAGLAEVQAIHVDEDDYRDDVRRVIEALSRLGVTRVRRQAFPKRPVKSWGEARAIWEAPGSLEEVRERLLSAFDADGFSVSGSDGGDLLLKAGSRRRTRTWGGFFVSESSLPCEARLRLGDDGSFVVVEVLLVEDMGPGVMKGMAGRYESRFNNVLLALRRASERRSSSHE